MWWHVARPARGELASELRREGDGERRLLAQKLFELDPGELEQLGVTRRANRREARAVRDERELAEHGAATETGDHAAVGVDHLAPSREDDEQGVARVPLAEQPLAPADVDHTRPVRDLPSQLRFEPGEDRHGPQHLRRLAEDRRRRRSR